MDLPDRRIHCARWVLSCLCPLFIKERRMYICSPPLFMEERTYICPPFCGTANEQHHCLILWSVSHFTIQVFFRTFYIHNLEIEKKCGMAMYISFSATPGNKCCHGNTFFCFLDSRILLWVLCFPYPCTDWS